MKLSYIFKNYFVKIYQDNCTKDLLREISMVTLYMLRFREFPRGKKAIELLSNQ